MLLSTEDYISLVSLWIKGKKIEYEKLEIQNSSVSDKSLNETIQTLQSLMDRISISVLHCWESLVFQQSSEMYNPGREALNHFLFSKEINSTSINITLVAESTADPLPSSSWTSPTWPSLAARWRALSPFWEEKQTRPQKWSNDEADSGWSYASI